MTQNISDYLDLLASSSSTPGGGSTSALIAALSSALASMVASLTTGKKKYAQFEEDLQRILCQTSNLKNQFQALMLADEEAFAPLAQAYRIPKEDPDRTAKLDKCLTGAMQPPLEVLHLCEELLPIVEELSHKGSSFALSDVACAASALRDAACAASMNIFINTKLLSDRSYAHTTNQSALSIVDNIYHTCDRLTSTVQTQLLRSSLDHPSPVKELRGMPVVKSICEALVPQIESLTSQNIIPTLAIIRVGANPDDLSYEKGITKRFESNHARVIVHEHPMTVTQDELEKDIISLNQSSEVHGILVFRPLPKHLNEKRLAALIHPSKDVDCMSENNLAKVFTGSHKDEVCFPPCTPQAVIEILDGYHIDCTGKKVVVVGRSVVVGKPLSMLLLQKNATVTLCHTRTKDLAAECRRADILIACAGVARMITPDFTNPNQIVIDVGINFVDGVLCGDVDYEQVAPVVDFITPVPGGVGTLTSTVILKHTIMSALH